ncbi:nicotinamide-nucleotide amidase [Vibrio agarivorans]|uniref:Nicotinamide-nucleotide amidase n=1 Tax=Vibrio agarivorans TaxID=153622 RepID=A0ABT7XWU9_9VIBR|nr:nicotinamide-nucleotide amidase [Vibrio agarivorans]MDN2480215.1 nicotinamide-nucleotide amidase [Vibrio agarivorans]
MSLLLNLSKQLGEKLGETKQVLVTAESCTGGGVANAITEVEGSSAWFDRAFITYSNEAKMEMLGVKPQTLESFGAVSEATVIEMAQGALERSLATIAVSISGIAGPGGGSEDKPVGTVCFAFVSNKGWQLVETCHFEGDRSEVRLQAIEHVLTKVYRYLDHSDVERG